MIDGNWFEAPGKAGNFRKIKKSNARIGWDQVLAEIL
jgi:hypothetical protein